LQHDPLQDEAYLLARIAGGDEQAFSTLFHHYWDRLYNYLNKVTKSPEIAGEIAADVFLKLWTARSRITGIRNMDGFLFRIARNKAIDFFKMAARNERLRQMVARSMEQSAAPAADQRMLDEELAQALAQAIAGLSPRRKLIFTLSRVEGLSNEEIATKLNLSPHTVKNTLVDSVRSIRALLQKKHSVG
jgi:RNA polymerase sigma-70 factor (ECF subfamily)